MRDLTRWIIGGGFGLAVLALVASVIVGERLDTGHVRLHAIVATVLLTGAVTLQRARPTLGPGARVLMLGLLAFASAQLIESAGAFGFGSDGYQRENDLVVFHDLGVSITPIGLILLGFGIAVPASIRFVGLAARWIPRPIAIAIAMIASTIIVMFPILTLIGIPIPGL